MKTTYLLPTQLEAFKRGEVVKTLTGVKICLQEGKAREVTNSSKSVIYTKVYPATQSAVGITTLSEEEQLEAFDAYKEGKTYTLYRGTAYTGRLLADGSKEFVKKDIHSEEYKKLAPSKIEIKLVLSNDNIKSPTAYDFVPEIVSQTNNIKVNLGEEVEVMELQPQSLKL